MRQRADWRVVFAACTLAMQITTDAAGTTRINNLDCFEFTLSFANCITVSKK